MAKKKIEVHIEIQTEKELECILQKHQGRIMCAEIYSEFSGCCNALHHMLRILKLDLSDGQYVILRVLADNIERLKRFRNRSEPIHIFLNGDKVTRVVRGTHAIEFRNIAMEELALFRAEMSGKMDVLRVKYDIDEPTPQEEEWQRALEAERMAAASERRRRSEDRQAQRKRHRALQLAAALKQLNFVLYWPHAKRAHPELYQRWDDNDIIMVGREELQLTTEQARDVLYAGDSPGNEAAMHALLAGEALAICFRILDKERDFVALVRHILYEEIPAIEEKKPQQDQPVQRTAFDVYSSYSLTAEEIRQQRREQKAREKAEERSRRARRISETRRLAAEAGEERARLRKQAREAHKLALLKAGNLSALQEDDEDDEEPAEEVLPEEVEPEESTSEEEEEDPPGYFPPAGLLVPGLYAPPNDIAKANALAVLFPKIVSTYVKPPPEFLPPHVLVLLPVEKRYQALGILRKYKAAIIHMGIFRVAVPFRPPYRSQQLASSVKQYDNVFRTPCNDAHLAMMVSVKHSLPLLLLVDLSPPHVSLDAGAGEEESATIFPVGYGDGNGKCEDLE